MSIDERFLQADKHLNRIARQYERELIRNYQLALKEIRGMIATSYERYGSDGALSFAEMQKYSRLTNLERNISKEISKLTATSARTLKRGMGEVFAESYYRAGYLIESEVQALLGFGLLNPKTIEASVLNPLDRVGFLQRNRDNQARLTRQLREQLTQGLIQGKSYQQTAKAIKERMDVGAANTVRIAATEMHRSMVAGRLAGFEKAESTGVKTRRAWVSTLDAKTRVSHQSMDGKYANENNLFEFPDGALVMGPGMHPDPAESINCRCAVRLEVVGFAPEFRRARGEGIIPYTDYKSWKEARINP